MLFEQELLSVPKEREREQQISEAEDGGSGDSSAVNDSQHHPKTVPEKNEADIIPDIITATATTATGVQLQQHIGNIIVNLLVFTTNVFSE